MELEDPGAAGAVMQAIDVLCNQIETRLAPFEFHKGQVRRVRFGRGHGLAPLVVPFPDQPGIARKNFGGFQTLGLVSPPETARAAIGGYAALRRNSRASERRHRFRGRKPGARFFEFSHSQPTITAGSGAVNPFISLACFGPFEGH